MKTKCILLFLSLFLISIGCEKQNTTEVENYVAFLKSGQYDSYDMPEFKPSDIPTLLKYIYDTTSTTKFPRNAISSYIQMKCSLGMVVLWTIESIRAVEIQSERLIGRFPSQNPFLQLKVHHLIGCLIMWHKWLQPKHIMTGGIQIIDSNTKLKSIH